jgi:long-chain fatty acid transport protein
MKNIKSILLPALVSTAFSGSAGAAGFQLLEQNASGLGNAYAGSAAVAENASTIFYNPAGMTQLKAREYSVGITLVQPSFKFSDSGTSVGATGAGNGGDGGQLGVLPNGYLSWAYDKDLYLGISLGAPFGLMTKYSDPWLGAAQSTSFDVKTYNINPSIAYRINETVSIGGGVSWQRLEAVYKRRAGDSTLLSGVLDATPVRLGLKDEAWGWNVGALFSLSPASKLGISYRSRIKYDATGKVEASGPSSTVNGLGTSDAKASIELPDTFIASLTHQYSDQWEALADLSWTGWSSIPKIDVVRTSGASAGAVAQTLITDFRDSWRFAVGGNYKMRDDLKLKFGIAYDQTPVKGAATRLVSLPDNNRTWLSFGTQWKASKDSTLDVGVAYLLMKDAPIDNNQTTAFPPRGRITGTYKDNCWILGAQYSASF